MKMHLVRDLAALPAMMERAEAVRVGNDPDAMIAATEGCDGNNATDGDGCSSSCAGAGAHSLARPRPVRLTDVQ